jgi:hypothetical protein
VLSGMLVSTHCGRLVGKPEVIDGPRGQVLVSRVVSMGRCNTGLKPNLQMFQRLNSFESADSKKTLSCLGLIEYSPKDQVSLKNTIGSTE